MAAGFVALAPSPRRKKADATLVAEPVVQPEPVDEVVPWDESMAPVVSEFVDETRGQLEEADTLLLAGTLDPSGVDALFRIFHTIKGVSGFLSIHQLRELAHRTETCLDGLRRGGIPAGPALIDELLMATALAGRLLQWVEGAQRTGTGLRPLPDVRLAMEALFRPAAPSDGISDAASIGGSFSTITDGAMGAVALSPPPSAGPSRAADSQAALPARDAPAPAGGPRAAIALPPPPSSAPPRPRTSIPNLADRKAAAPAPEGPAASPPVTGEAQAGADDGRTATHPVASDAAPKSPEVQTADQGSTVRIALDRIDRLVEMVGELVIGQAMALHAAEAAGHGQAGFVTELGRIAKVTRELQSLTMQFRMVPLKALFQRCERLIRHLSRKAGKPLTLRVLGAETEMDRSVVERLADPLVHLLRNAADHGIEDPDRRAVTGKSAEGHITLAARYDGGSVVITLADDGGGLHRDRILQRARERGLVGQGVEPPDAEVWPMIFLPGFSTAAVVSDLSGRGVGMDVVKSTIEGLRGRVLIETAAGRGTTFRLVLPMTTAIIDGTLIACGPERYLLPTRALIQVFRPSAGAIHAVGRHGRVVHVGASVVPLLSLRALLGLPAAVHESDERIVVLLEVVGGQVALSVDEVRMQQQVVIKNPGAEARRAGLFSGAAILGDGTVGFIIDPEALATYAERLGRAGDGQAWRTA